MRKNQIIVDISISSRDLHYTEISKILGLQYDNFCDIGGRYNNVGFISKEEYIWGKESGVDKYEENMDIHFETLFKILRPLKEDLLKLKKMGCNFQMSVVMYYHQANPGIHIDPEYTEFLGEIGASVDCDIYCLSED